MKLEHSFTIPVPVEQAWPILLDIQQIAPCMPGASVDSVDGDDFTGSVKVKLGPINLTYKGQAKFVEKDESAHKAVIDARGRDARGNGTAAAKITAQLTGSGDETECSVVTDLNITGKPAQFGRGVMVDVGNKLIGQFADCLAGKLSSDDSGDSGDSGDSADTAKSDEKPAEKDLAEAKPSDVKPSDVKPADANAVDASTAGATDGAAAASAAGAAAGAAGAAAGAAGAAAAKSTDDDKTPTGSVKVSDIEQAADRDSASAQKGAAPSAPATPAKPAPPATPAKPTQEAEPIDLLELAGGSVAKRAIPAVAGLAILIAIIAIISGKKKK